MKILLKFTKFILPVLGFMLLWEGFARLKLFNPELFPPMTEVFVGMFDLLKTGTLVIDIFWSSFRAIVGFAAGSALGILVGVLTGRTKFFDVTVTPLMQVLRAIPSVALVPLVIAWVGLGETPKIILVTWGVYFPTWINAYIGVSSVDINYVRAAQCLGADYKTIMRKVVLPSALPIIVAGMRVGIALAFLNLVAAEMAGASKGLGFRIQYSHMIFKIDHMISAIIWLGILGAGFDRGFASFINKLFPWQRQR